MFTPNGKPGSANATIARRRGGVRGDEDGARGTRRTARLRGHAARAR